MSTKSTVATILTIVVFYLRLFLDKMLDFLFSLYWDDKKKIIPDLDKRHTILTESAVTLARKIKAKELKSEDLVRAVIERIKEVNPILNAVVRERYEAALEDARQVDRLIAAGLSDQDANKPFLGVPFTTKESQEIKGFCNTIGLWSRRNVISTEDSDAIVLLKRAGAIPLAATNLPELLIWQETRNPVYGMTLNPHHTGRSPGGSSGAEAALCATYATPISLCSDIGGSTRMPAFYCGMFGHHPTAGITSVKGVFFRKGDEGDTMFCLGFISRCVEDLAPLTKVIAGDKSHLLHLDKDVNIQDIKVYYMESADDRLVSPVRIEMKNAMQRVVSKLSEESGAPERYSHAGFRHMYRLWSYWMSREPDDYMALYGDGQRPNAFLELAKKCVGMSNHCLFTILRLFELKYLPGLDAAWAENITKEMKEDLFGKLGDNGVLLLPSSPHAAPFHYSAVLRPFNFSYFGIVNVLKCPATQVPLGRNSVGLPIGIQVLAAPHNDHLCLAVAKYLEKEFGGAIMACEVKT
ncbi:PREDICTED: fatty-acid amide hydrolase 2-like [Papilio xuthus]|uniref:Fatty-acid amide hydrolase 2-like n=1 Tax=Papilio xuthus TaxID=66420 RepID=A0AAJ6Z7M8_PAPXU|nr:PREDICTED: fatty-acid amide hydrolase 2-like [Papilio xuthus]XP_013166814.1 PREDICTED: fatty-acid amide hydrolase 2-like [Papilio xuthus]